ELERFCDAMIAIRGEIDRVAAADWPLEQSPLRHAPHTAADLLADWDRPYPRDLGAYPLASLRADRCFAPVSRFAAAYGDRKRVCSCERIERYASTVAAYGGSYVIRRHRLARFRRPARVVRRSHPAGRHLEVGGAVPARCHPVP